MVNHNAFLNCLLFFHYMHDLHSLHFHSLVFNNTQYFVYRPPIIFSFTKKKKKYIRKNDWGKKT